MKKKLRQVAREPALDIDADQFHIKIFPEAQIIAFYKRTIEGNRIVTSKKPMFRLRAYDFRHCPDAFDSVKAWINTWEVK